MEKKIIFGKPNFNYIYILLYTITIFIKLEIKILNFVENIDSVHNYKFLDNLMKIYIFNLSNFFAIIPFLIKRKYSKRNKDNNKTYSSDLNNKDKQNNESSILIYNDINEDEENKRKKTFIFYSFVTSSFIFLEEFSEVLFYIIYPDKEYEPYVFSCTVPFDIILQFITSHFILKIYFYKLQYFALSIDIIIFIIILIIDIINIIYNNSFEPIIFLFNLFGLIFSSLGDVYGKKAILYGFKSIYSLMIIVELFTLIFTIIMSLIILIVDKNIFIELGIFFSESKYILLIIANIIESFFENLFYWLIIDRFNPNYIPFALILEEFCYYIDIKAIHPEYYEIMGCDEYFRLSLYIILFVFVMVHNEIIIINMCGLASETKYFLDLKLKSEEIFTKSANYNILKRYESEIEMDMVAEPNDTSCESIEN